LASSGSFNLNVFSCFTTIFGTPLNIAKTPPTSGITDFPVLINYYVEVDSSNPEDDANYPWTT
jgi:hypothetical protein